MTALSPRSAEATAAILHILTRPAAQNHVWWPTGQIEHAITQRPHGQLVYRMLDRLWKRGEIGRAGGRRSPHFSAFWRWWPNEHTCDQPYPPVTIDCAPAWCLRHSKGCWPCQTWANHHLGRPGRRTRPAGEQ